MLTRQRRFAASLADPADRRIYRMHMCGLCHTLAGRYGPGSQLLTGYETILLNMLTGAQQPHPPAPVARRCPINPLLKVPANHDAASRFAAAAAVALAHAGFADHVQDSRGRDLGARLVCRALERPRRAAYRDLDALGFDTGVFVRLPAEQGAAEQYDLLDPAAPAARAAAALFAMTAHLAGCPQNAGPLAAAGAAYGAYLYLLDAYHDYARDRARGHYNPLRRFGPAERGGPPG
ncbi:MAG: hypothetical protein JXB47_18405, partial [Anaerolineae bacterium]|nr:hypothetical protein [Anaerolineae bacterium]